MSPTEPIPDVWNFRKHNGRMTPGTTWRDSKGRVTLFLSYSTYEGSSAPSGGVVYQRGKRTYQLGERRWARDFKPVIKRRTLRRQPHGSPSTGGHK